MSTYSSHFDGAMPRFEVKHAGETFFGRITVWLALAVVIGAWIAIYDGLTRDFVNDYEVGNVLDVLQYEAYKMGWLFAGVVLPLILIHGKKLGFSLSESYLLWFVFCTSAYTKDFAYIKVPGAPIYITDVSLSLFVVSFFLWPRLRIPKLNNAITRSLLFFAVLGLVAAARGIASGMVITDVLRDLSVVVYTAFLLLALYSRHSRELTRQYCLMMICGAIVGTVAGVSWYVSEPEMRRYILYGMYVPESFVLVALLMWNRKMSFFVGFPLMLMLGVGVMVCNARTVFLALTLTLAVMIFTGFAQLRLKEIIKPVLVASLAMVLAIGLLLQTKEGSGYIGRITIQLVQGFAHAGEDDNTQWRLLAWAEAGRRFINQPVMGEGFGVPFTFEKSGIDVKPHNIYLTIVYKMGIVGAIPFTIFMLVCIFGPWRTLRRYRSHPDSLLLRALFLCQFYALVFGAINPLIESPFLASMFWLNMGFMVRLAWRIKEDSEQSSLAAAAA